MHNLISAFLFLLILTINAAADPVAVPAHEIKTFLIGNTIRGTWLGNEYRQYFNPDGSTIYATRKAQSALGKWRVNEKTNEYESWWERTEWSAYRITRDGDQFFWNSNDLESQPFMILPGQQLVWTD